MDSTALAQRPVRSPDPGERFEVVLISPYELGRQPFALAEPAAWLDRAGFAVHCLDLSLQKLDCAMLRDARLVALYLGMHTATRIALAALPRIRELAPGAHLCAYGLYAPMNRALLASVGVASVLGGECEPDLVELARRLRTGAAPGARADAVAEPSINLSRIDFLKPDRSHLPALARYAHLTLPDGATRVQGFAEASRGCKHLCRHCPVVPVYRGRFRIVPVNVVIEDIAQQVAAGAQHISFGDPDFFNGPTHASKILAAMHGRFPELTFDATIKIEHLIQHPSLLPRLKEAGCLFITSAVESVDDAVLERLAKNHTRADFERALAACRAAGIALTPTFVPFTPWTTLPGYLDLLRTLVRLRLIEAVAPVQLSIRLLVPEGSLLLDLPGFRNMLGPFDARLLGYPWRHADPRIDALQQEVQACVARGEADARSRGEIFGELWRLAHEKMGLEPPPLDAGALGAVVPRASEPWYCCAEPTDQQLQTF